LIDVQAFGSAYLLPVQFWPPEIALSFGFVDTRYGCMPIFLLIIVVPRVHSQKKYIYRLAGIQVDK